MVVSSAKFGRARRCPSCATNFSEAGQTPTTHNSLPWFGPYELAGYTNCFTFQMTAPDGPYTASLREHSLVAIIYGSRSQHTPS
jgi:hypothetical protein